MGSGQKSSSRSLIGTTLRARRSELEAAVAARLATVAPWDDIPDRAYVEGLHSAIAAGVDHVIRIFEGSDPQFVPPALLVQARLAAQNEIGLETVLRRYLVGMTTISHFVLEEAEREIDDSGAVYQALREQTLQMDRVVDQITKEHRREVARSRQYKSRRLERVRAVLGGEMWPATSLGYPLTGGHIALVARGTDAEVVVTGVAQDLGWPVLQVLESEKMCLAWFGGSKLTTGTLARVADSAARPGCAIAIGERGDGIAGFRRSHREAMAALSVAELRPDDFARYADVALLTSILRDELVEEALRREYLDPLDSVGEDRQTTFDTLRAYLEAGQQVTSAASILNVARNTVTNRLKAIEGVFGRPLRSCLPELQCALQLTELHQSKPLLRR